MGGLGGCYINMFTGLAQCGTLLRSSTQTRGNKEVGDQAVRTYTGSKENMTPPTSRCGQTPAVAGEFNAHLRNSSLAKTKFTQLHSTYWKCFGVFRHISWSSSADVLCAVVMKMNLI